jgi:hypothetical protein
MARVTVPKEFIPLDKSWTIRIGVLDLVNGSGNTQRLLEKERVNGPLSTDLSALLRATKEWQSGERKIPVGESATLYRFLRFYCWKHGFDREFVLEGTLKERKITHDIWIPFMPLQELLKLDSGTSQWASASVLFGNRERVENPSPKLKLTYEAAGHWREMMVTRTPIEPRYDDTIRRQAEAFLEFLYTGKMNFELYHSEDYCFGRAFRLIDRHSAEIRWPSLAGHESNRFESMEKAYVQMLRGQGITSDDHRVVQAVAMAGKTLGLTPKFHRPHSVDKSWPQFWNFISAVNLGALGSST